MSLKQLTILTTATFTLMGLCCVAPRAIQNQLTLNDFSRLNQTTVHRITTPTSYQELQDTVAYAQANNLKVSIAGKRHSQGGHAFYPNAIVVDLKKLNKICHFNPVTKLITVQTGITWKEIQDYLNQRGFAVKIMQFANLFTVGGSLSVNCNGIDPSCGPLIESVRSIKLLTASGEIITASRTQNPELFYSAIGGFGLFGIILEASLEVAENSFYKRTTKSLSLTDYVQFLKQLPHNPSVGFHFAFLKLSLYSKKLFSDVVAFNFTKLDTAKLSRKKRRRARKLYQEKWVKARTWQTRIWTKSRLVKALHWIPEGLKHGQIISRNNIMRPPAQHLYVEMYGETNLLQEYFIPVDNLVPFIESLEQITKKLNVNLLHVALRFIPQNTESMLSYTDTDRVGIVLFFNQPMTSAGDNQTKQWTQHLIDMAIALNGTYYLPIQLHATKSQLETAYPQIHDFFALKQQYDPHELFMNHFYAKYGFTNSAS